MATRQMSHKRCHHMHKQCELIVTTTSGHSIVSHPHPKGTSSLHRTFLIQTKRLRTNARNIHGIYKIHKSNKNIAISNQIFGSYTFKLSKISKKFFTSTPQNTKNSIKNNLKNHTHNHSNYSEYHVKSSQNNAFWKRFGIDSSQLLLGLTSSGFLGGLIGGLAGTGGGVIMIPLLKSLTKMTSHQIAGASLSAVVGGTFVATMSYSQQTGMICAPVAITMSICSIFSAIIGVKLAPKVSNRLLTTLISIFLFGGIVPIYNKVQRSKQQITSKNDKNTTNNRIVESRIDCKEQMRLFMKNPLEWMVTNYEYPLLGCMAGILTGLMGLGGGVVMTSYLAAYTDLTQYQVIGTSLVCMLPQSIIASILHASHGTVGLPLAVTLACSNAIGMFTASQVALDIDETYLQIGLCVILGISATSMARNSWMLWTAKSMKSNKLTVKTATANATNHAKSVKSGVNGKNVESASNINMQK